MSDNIYISKIHGAKIRDEELTRRFEASQKKESKFANVMARPNLEVEWPKLNNQLVVNFTVYSLDYDGVTYNLNDVEAFKALVDALKKDGYEFDEKRCKCDLSDYHIKIDKFDADVDDAANPALFDLQGEVHSIKTDYGIVDTQYVRGSMSFVYTGNFEAVYIISACLNDPSMTSAYCIIQQPEGK